MTRVADELALHRGAGSTSPPDGGLLPGSGVHPFRSAVRYVVARVAAAFLVRCYLHLRVEGRELLPPGPALICFNHQSWADPFVVMAALPWRPRLFFFGPREEDMARGARNRIMSWTGTTVPYRPGKRDLIEATRRVDAVFASGGVLAIAAEGRIHAGERVLLPLNEGAAYFALRSDVPLVPLAINGIGWLSFGRHVRVRIGHPIRSRERPTREAVEALTGSAWRALQALVADFPDTRVPGPIGRRITELFNEWPEGARPEPDAPGGEGDPDTDGAQPGMHELGERGNDPAGPSGILTSDPIEEEVHGSERPVAGSPGVSSASR